MELSIALPPSPHRVCVFGIGDGVDKAMVTKLANAGRGHYEFVTSLDRSMETSVMNAMRTALTPAAVDLSLSLEPSEDFQLEVEKLPTAVYQGESHVITGKVKSKVSRRPNKYISA